RSASARLVSGPVAIAISSPGCARAARTHASAASWSVSSPAPGGSVAYPSPCGPWVSSAVRSCARNGRSAPFDTGTSVTPHMCSRSRLLRQTWCTGTFPAVEAMPTSRTSGQPSRYISANASSTPVSTSAKTGMRSSPGVVTPPTIGPRPGPIMPGRRPKGTPMPLDPNAKGRTTEPRLFEWTDRDTLLYALGVGAGTADLAFTTENSHGIEQQVRPTYAVIASPAWGAMGLVGEFDFARRLHGSQSIRLFAPLRPNGRLSVVAEVADIQDKGPGKNAIVVFKGTGTDPDTGQVVAETVSTAVIRGAGGFGGEPGQRPPAPEIPDRAPDAELALPTREDQALIYRLSGDR